MQQEFCSFHLQCNSLQPAQSATAGNPSLFTTVLIMQCSGEMLVRSLSRLTGMQLDGEIRARGKTLSYITKLTKPKASG